MTVTAPLLLACICTALVFQLAVGIGVAVLRRRGGAAARTAVGRDITTPRVGSGAWPGWREFRVTRREFEDRAHTQCSFYLEPIDATSLPPFRPGQFLTFTLQVAWEQGGERTVTRCYSLSDPPKSTSYRVTVKRVLAPAGRPELPAGVSSNHFHDRVHEGDVLRVKAPSGNFCIDPEANVSAVLIAGGIGITPLMSMLQWCLGEQPQRTVHLYYGLRHGDEHVFKQTLEELGSSHPNFHLNVVYSQPGINDVQGRDFHHAGHVNVELLRRTLPHGRHQFYVCGPPPMMESLVPALRDWAVIEADIHYEAFGPASVRSAHVSSNERATTGAVPFEVRFQRAGRTLSWDGTDASLLDFGQRHGVALDSGCRAGSCGSCETRLISGTVRYAHKPDYDFPSGTCLLCVGTPESALVLDA